MFRYLLKLSLFLLIALRAHAESRVWTDIEGKKITATMLGFENERVRVLYNGKEIEIPIRRLSRADQEYAESWKPGDEGGDDDQDEPAANDDEKEAPKKPAAAGSSTFDGKELVTGGKVNVYEYKYSEEYAETIKRKFKSDDKGYRIGIAVPADFDPTKPQKVIVVCQATNNAKQTAEGNIGAAGFYAKWAVSNGWVCVGYNSDIGLAAPHDGANILALEKITQVWPGFRTWVVATGGNSGGAKGALTEICLIKKKGFQARGVFLGGCNHAGNLASGRDRYKISKGDVRELRFYNSYYEGPDGDATVKGVISTLKGEGGVIIRDVRFKDSFDERKNQFQTALDWFAQAAP